MLGQAEYATAGRARCLRHHRQMERVVLGEPGPQRQPEHAPPAEGAPEGPDAPSGEAKARDKKFLIGTAISVYQNSGDPASQWDHFQGRRVLGGLLPSIMNGDRMGKSTDFWDRHAVFLASARPCGSSLALTLARRLVKRSAVLRATSLRCFAVPHQCCGGATGMRTT